jgi:hypothetical protein
MEDEQFSGEESLRLIQSMINRAQDKFAENGHLYLLWGWVVFVCSLTQFGLQRIFHLSPENTWMVWLLTWVALIYQIAYIRQKRRKLEVRTYTQDIVSYVWIVFGISTILMAFILGTNKQPMLVNPVLLVSYGIPTFLSGIIIRFRPLIWGAVFCWVLAVICSQLKTDLQLVLIALAVLLAWIIPGYQLRNKFKQTNS